MKRQLNKKSSLSNKALLVSVTISQWGARKIDQKATSTANTAHKASASAGNYHKKLLPGAKELDDISYIASHARKYFHEQTLPWMSDGSRIISGKNYMDFAAQMRKIKSTFEDAVAEFTKAYPKLQQAAQAQLGDLYNSDEYPLPEEIADKFKIETSFLPLPDVKDFRTEVTEAEKKDFIKKMREVESTAMKECWDRLHTVVSAAASKLSQPDAIFRDSLIENILEIVEILPKLNITDDPNLEKSRREVEKLVSGLDTQEIRKNAEERVIISKQLSDIEIKMGAYMGKI